MTPSHPGGGGRNWASDQDGTGTGDACCPARGGCIVEMSLGNIHMLPKILSSLHDEPSINAMIKQST